MKKILIKFSVMLFLTLLVANYIVTWAILPEKNPPTTQEASFNQATTQIMEESCYDCHSNRVVYPWYSYMPGVSVLVARDVAEGREEVNFSTWDKYSATKQSDLLEDSLEEIQDEEMPMDIYVLMHPSAAITADEYAILLEGFREHVAINSNKPPAADFGVNTRDDDDDGDDDDDDDDDDDHDHDDH